MRSLYLSVLGCVFFNTLIVAHKPIKSSFETKSDPVDTTTFVIDTTAFISNLTYHDSLTIFPAYDIYCKWDTSVIHPYKSGVSVFKDTINLALTGINSSSYVPPCIGSTNSDFGPRRRRAHFGIDLELETGDSVLNAFDGMVRIAKRNHSYGNVVIVRHENGLETIYAHLSKLLVEPNQCVKAGDLIGLGGNTGHSYGSHLHFEIRYKGEPINPNEVISFEDQRLVSDTLRITKNSFELYYKYKSGKYPYSKGKAGYHTVRKGDTLYAIARKHKTSVSRLCKLNKIKPTTVLNIGQKIKYG